MLWTALQDPDPVLLFEHGSLYNMSGTLAEDAGHVDIQRAAVRRPGRDVTLVSYGGSLSKTLDAAETLAADGIEAEVLDLRSLRPLDDEAIMESVSHTHRAVVVDEGWRSGSLSAEISARITEQCFFDLDSPVERVCSAEVPMPYAKHLEEAALPQPETVVAAVRRAVGWWPSSRCPRSAPTWTRARSSSGSCTRATPSTAVTRWRSWTPTSRRSRSSPSTTAWSSLSRRARHPCRGRHTVGRPCSAGRRTRGRGRAPPPRTPGEASLQEARCPTRRKTSG